MNRRKAIGKAMAKEEFLSDGTTSTEPTGRKVNPKGVDNYKSGAVKIAPVDEADPQNGYGVKEEVEKKDNRANYAYINFMKNKLRAGMGIKNPMVMVDPDKAKEKFEKMATSITASTGEEEEKEGVCESASVAQALEALKEADVQGKFMPSNPQFKGVGANKKFNPEMSGTTSYNKINLDYISELNEKQVESRYGY